MLVIDSVTGRFIQTYQPITASQKNAMNLKGVIIMGERNVDISCLRISYLKHGERLIYWDDKTDNPIDSWIICHPEDGEVVASSDDEDTAHEMFSAQEIADGLSASSWMNTDHLTPGLIDSIIFMWPSQERYC